MAKRDRIVSDEKVRVRINPRSPFRELNSKFYRDQFGGGHVDGSDMVPDVEQLAEKIDTAGWSDDPGTGVAVILPDGREVLNPVPMAPPIGYVAQPTLMEMMEQMLRVKLQQLRDDDEVDTAEDAEDFDIPDELGEPPTMYEFVSMADEFPEFRAARESRPEAEPEDRKEVTPGLDDNPKSRSKKKPVKEPAEDGPGDDQDEA